MNKDLKSILASFAIVTLYVYATIGIVSMFSKTKSDYINSTKANMLFITLILGTLFWLIVPYHAFGPSSVEPIYMLLIVSHIIYLIIGCIGYPNEK